MSMTLFGTMVISWLSRENGCFGNQTVKD